MLIQGLLSSGLAGAGQKVMTTLTSQAPAVSAALGAKVSSTTERIPKAGQPSILNPDGSATVSELVVEAPRGQSVANKSKDLRVRLRPQDSQKDKVYGKEGVSNILSILYKTNGVLFPYTPTVNFSQDVDYKTIDLVHSNYDINAYNRTPSVSLSIAGKFSVQNKREGEYAIAVLHFLRTASKMYFGDEDASNGLAGLPPPVLLFSGYGAYMFNDLRVVLKSHSYTFDDSVDMVEVNLDGIITKVPALFTVSLALGVQQTPYAMREKFSLDTFRTGELMRRGGGWI